MSLAATCGDQQNPDGPSISGTFVIFVVFNDFIAAVVASLLKEEEELRKRA